MKNRHDEALDGDGNPVHFVPGEMGGVKGYEVVEGRSPVLSHAHNDKRKKLRAERKRKKKHQKRGR